MPPELQPIAPKTIQPPPPAAWEQSVPANELLKPTEEALQREVPTPEDAAKLNLRSATEEEWSSPENNLDLLQETPEQRAARLHREDQQEKEQEWDLRRRTARLESIFGEHLFSRLITMEADPEFRALPKEQKYAKAFEKAAQYLVNGEFRLLFPDGNTGKLLQAYARILEEMKELPETVEEMTRAQEEFVTSLKLMGPPPPAEFQKGVSPQEALQRRTNALKSANQLTQAM